MSTHLLAEIPGFKISRVPKLEKFIRGQHLACYYFTCHSDLLLAVEQIRRVFCDNYGIILLISP